MTSILLESKDQLLINPSFTFFPLLEGNLPQLRYVFSLLLFNLWTQTKRSVDQPQQATCRGEAWFLEIRGSPKSLAQSQNLRSILDRSPSLVFRRFWFSESWTSNGKRNNIRWTSCCRWNSNQKQEVWYPAKTYVSSTKENKIAMGGVWRGKGRNVLRNVSQKISIVSRQVVRLAHFANVYWARANSQALG